MKMKISWIKQADDENSFKIAEKFKMQVYKLKEPEDVDNTMNYLIEQNCKTIVLTSDIAGFSEDIIKKYNSRKDINIIISKRK